MLLGKGSERSTSTWEKKKNAEWVEKRLFATTRQSSSNAASWHERTTRGEKTGEK
jgi:hypothetical protein